MVFKKFLQFGLHKPRWLGNYLILDYAEQGRFGHYIKFKQTGHLGCAQQEAFACYNIKHPPPNLPNKAPQITEASYLQQLCHINQTTYPPPLLKSPPPPCNLPPQGGDRHFTVLRGNIYCGGLCSPSVIHTSLHCFPITSNQSPVCLL